MGCTVLNLNEAPLKTIQGPSCLSGVNNAWGYGYTTNHPAILLRVPTGLSANVSLIEYENTPVKVVALRKTPKIETPGLVLDEVDERKEFSVPFWVASVLVETGLAKYGEEGLTTEEWTSTHFKERFNPGGPPGALSKDFYAKAFISLTLAAKAAEGDPAKVEQLNRLHARFREIIESRVNKVTRIATTETSPQPGILQTEEQVLYQSLEHIIAEWRRDLRRLGTK